MSRCAPMKLALALVAAFFALPAWGRGDTSHFVDKLSCDSGPYSLKLPDTYDALRKIGPLKGEKLLREQDRGTYRARYRDLQFNGLPRARAFASPSRSFPPSRRCPGTTTTTSPTPSTSSRARCASSCRSPSRKCACSPATPSLPRRAARIS